MNNLKSRLSARNVVAGGNELGVGEHAVRLTHYAVTSADKKWDGTDSGKVKPWIDLTEQALMTFGSPKGYYTLRLTGSAYKHVKEDEIVPEGYACLSSEGFNERYLCKKNDDGTYSRVLDEEKTETCLKKIDAIAAIFGTGNPDEILSKTAQDINSPVVTIVLKERNGEKEFSHLRKSAPRIAVVANAANEGDQF